MTKKMSEHASITSRVWKNYRFLTLYAAIVATAELIFLVFR